MRKLLVLILMLGFSFSIYGCGGCGDTPMDRMADWVAVYGKEGVEKKLILAERKSIREIRCIKPGTNKTVAETKKKSGL